MKHRAGAAMLAFVYLIAALLLFLLSTKQWRLWIRGLIWLGGAALVAAAVLQARSISGHYDLLRALQDAAGDLEHPQNTVLWQSFLHNRYAATRFVPALVDTLIACGAALGLLALLAFTPGQRMEKALRPIKIGFIGAIVGVAFSLVIVSVGFGAPINARDYSFYADASKLDVHDGDTFWIGEISVRVWGIDAPELGQQCSDHRQCGELARGHLLKLLRGELVRCEAVTKDATHQASDGPGNEVMSTFGRPLVSCQVMRPDERGGEFDLAEQMISDGFATYYRGRVADEFERRIEELKQLAPVSPDSDSVMSSCWLEPSWLRSGRSRQDRVEFAGTHLSQIRPEHLIGACPT